MGLAYACFIAVAETDQTLADQCFFALCSDVICEFPLRDMLKFHQSQKAEGTILVTKVSPLNFPAVMTANAVQ